MSTLFSPRIFVLLGALLCVSPEARATELGVGKKAPPFKLPTLAEGEVDQSSLAGMPYVLVIGTSEKPAPQCKEWMVTLLKNFEGKKTAVYQVVVLNNAWYIPRFLVIDQIKDFVPAFGYPNVLIEWTFQFATDYGIPYDHDIRVLVVDPEGTIRYRHRGNMTDASLVQVINTVDQYLEPASAKPIKKSTQKVTEK